MAILVAQRRREVGIRIALGAHPSRAVRLILSEGIKSASFGVVLGIVMAAIAVLWLSRNISGTDFFHPTAFVAMTLLIIATAGTACYIPPGARVASIQWWCCERIKGEDERAWAPEIAVVVARTAEKVERRESLAKVRHKKAAQSQSLAKAVQTMTTERQTLAGNR
jgi:hypothetical protein